jgi:hypothetical protein
MAVKHTKVATTADDGTSEVGTNEWNDNHTIDNSTITNDHLAGSIANGKLATDPLARANHTGTQAASTVSDFDTEVANNSAVTANTAKISYSTAASNAVAANTAKVTNATHTGDVTGATALTIGADKVLLSMVAPAAKTESISIALGDEETVLAAASTTVPVTTFHMPYGFTLTDVKVGCTVAGTGAALLTVDVHEAGTTVLSTKVTVDATEKTSGTATTPMVISNSALAVDSLIEIFVDVIDTDNVASGVKVYLIGYQT